MTASILMNAGEVNYYPYPHMVIKEALPWDYYTLLSMERKPIDDYLQSQESGNNKRKDLHAHQALSSDIPEIWRDFIAFHTSNTFWQQVLDVFGDAIRFTYPHLEWDKPLRQYQTGIRFKEKADLNMECQPGINTCVTEEGTVRGPHLDNPIELVAGLLYMPTNDEPSGGDLEVMKTLKPPAFYGKAEIFDDCVERVGTVKYEPNTAVFFLNTPLSVHSVTPRPETIHTRKLVNFAMELNTPLFEVKHG